MPDEDVDIHIEGDPEPEPEPDKTVVVAPTVIVQPPSDPPPPAPDAALVGELASIRHEVNELKEKIEAYEEERRLAAAAEMQAIVDAAEAEIEEEDVDETIPEIEDLQGQGIFDGPRFWDDVIPG